MTEYINLKKIEIENQNQIQKKTIRAERKRGRCIVHNVSSS